jgi:hypothetical protein
VAPSMICICFLRNLDSLLYICLCIKILAGTCLYEELVTENDDVVGQL